MAQGAGSGLGGILQNMNAQQVLGILSSVLGSVMQGGGGGSSSANSDSRADDEQQEQNGNGLFLRTKSKNTDWVSAYFSKERKPNEIAVFTGQKVVAYDKIKGIDTILIKEFGRPVGCQGEKCSLRLASKAQGVHSFRNNLERYRLCRPNASGRSLDCYLITPEIVRQAERALKTSHRRSTDRSSRSRLSRGFDSLPGVTTLGTQGGNTFFSYNGSAMAHGNYQMNSAVFDCPT
jgi:hypothetical protein